MSKSEAKAAAARAERGGVGAVSSPPAKAAQKPRSAPFQSKPPRSAKQIKHKKADPNAVHAFNHRARFTKLKRSIHLQRQRALESTLKCSSRAGKEASTLNDSFTTSSSSMDGEGNVETSLNSSSHSLPPTTAAAAAAAAVCSVAQMDSLYQKLDSAMQHRRYGRAAFLKRSIRAHRQQLRRALLSAKTQPHSTTPRDKDVDCSPNTQSVGATEPTAQQPYRSFHPPTTLLGLGRHPCSDWVDQRSGRYPALCPPAHISRILRHFSHDGTVAFDEGEATEMRALLQRGVPLGVENQQLESPSRAASPPLAPAAKPTTLSRTQRKQRAALFVGSYCRNIITDGLEDACFTLLQGLYQEQHDLRQKQPLQFKARQRYVVGFQEVLKCLKAGRVKLVLLAADVEAVAVETEPAADPPLQAEPEKSAAQHQPNRGARRKAFQSLAEAVQLVQRLCGGTAGSEGSGPTQRAPPLCLTCMSRQRLSYALHAKGSHVGCVAVMQAEKSRDAFKAVMAYGRLLVNAYAQAEGKFGGSSAATGTGEVADK